MTGGLDMGKISLRIADLRKKSRVTQQELADSIGVSYHGGVIIGLN